MTSPFAHSVLASYYPISSLSWHDTEINTEFEIFSHYLILLWFNILQSSC